MKLGAGSIDFTPSLEGAGLAHASDLCRASELAATFAALFVYIPLCH